MAAADQGLASDAASRAEAAKNLANKHFQVEDGLTQVFWLQNGTPEAELSPGEPIKLLEVNAATVPSGVMPLYFGPAPASGILYPSVIVEVTPEEFERIRAEKLKLPQGWVIGEEFPRPAGALGGG